MEHATLGTIRPDAASIEIAPGIRYYADALDDPDAALEALRAEVRVRQQHITVGRKRTRVPLPRLTAWYGDPDALYSYSGIDNLPKPWTPALLALRDGLRAFTGVALNSCLVNAYRDGRSSISWHADNEGELRETIASVSLGATRTFQLKRRGGGPVLSVRLGHGSLLTMTVESQKTWLHSIPKEDAEGPRLNLTFRKVQPRKRR